MPSENEKEENEKPFTKRFLKDASFIIPPPQSSNNFEDIDFGDLEILPYDPDRAFTQGTANPIACSPRFIEMMQSGDITVSDFESAIEVWLILKEIRAMQLRDGTRLAAKSYKSTPLFGGSSLLMVLGPPGEDSFDFGDQEDE